MRRFLQVSTYILLFACFAQGEVKSQIVQNFPMNLSLPGYSLKSPYLSYDGSQMVYILESKDSVLLAESKKLPNGQWTPAHRISAVNQADNMPKDFDSPSYNHDASRLYFAMKYEKKDSTYDIWYSRKTAGIWQKPEKMSAPINTAENESAPSISPDGKTLFFTRYFYNADVSEYNCSRIWVSKYENNRWADPKLLPSPVNGGCDGTPRIAADGKTLYISSIREEGKGESDIYFAKNITENIWISPIRVDTVNSEKNELYPSFSMLENLLYFEQSEKNKKKGRVGCLAKIPTQYAPEPVVFLKGIVFDKNTNKPVSVKIDVRDPNSFVSLFSSFSDAFDGSWSVVMQKGKQYLVDIGSGKYSHVIFNYDTRKINQSVVEKMDFGLFTEARLKLSVFDAEIFEPLQSTVSIVDETTGENIQAEMQETGKGTYTMILPLGKKYKISAQKKRFAPNGFILDLSGIVQFQEFERDIELTQAKVDYKINVADAETGAGVDVEVEITNLSTNERTTKKLKTGSDGAITVNLRDGDRYDISVSPKGYAFFNTTIEPESETGSNSVDVKLVPLKQETSIVLNDINFEFNSAELKNSSFSELDRLIKLMETNPAMVIEIAAHSDDVGSVPYNLKLSDKRAASVLKYLTDKGIPEKSLSSKGYGKSKPKYLPENTEENRAKNRRVEMKVISIQ